jgi:hypothetical protein
VFYIANPFQTISPRVTAALINHLQSESSRLFSSFCARGEKKRVRRKHMHSPRVWPLMAPIVLRALFNCFSLKHLLTFFLFPVRAKHCAKALKSSRVLALEWLQARRDMHSCFQDFELRCIMATDFLLVMRTFTSIVFGSVFLFLFSNTQTNYLFFMHTWLVLLDSFIGNITLAFF